MELGQSWHRLVRRAFMAFFVVSLQLAGRNCLNGEKIEANFNPEDGRSAWIHMGRRYSQSRK
jgi:hypothetical protein